MIVSLSHTLTTHEPNWPGAPGLAIRPAHRLEAGDIANTHVVEIYSHYGTHCDLPYHFLQDGRTLTDYDITDFAFTRPVAQ